MSPAGHHEMACSGDLVRAHHTRPPVLRPRPKNVGFPHSKHRPSITSCVCLVLIDIRFRKMSCSDTLKNHTTLFSSILNLSRGLPRRSPPAAARLPAPCAREDNLPTQKNPWTRVRDCERGGMGGAPHALHFGARTTRSLQCMFDDGEMPDNGIAGLHKTQ